MEEASRKIKRSVLKRNKKKEKVTVSATQNIAVARLNDVPSSPRKMRLVADMIRGERVSKALSILKHDTKHPSAKLEKLLLSAISNWENKTPNVKLEDADMYVKEIYVNGGRMLKRLRPAPQGRAHRIRKRSNHVTLVVAGASVAKPKEVSAPKQNNEQSSEKPPKKIKDKHGTKD